jgi:hypothetical protein
VALARTGRKYCDWRCQQEYQRRERFERIRREGAEPIARQARKFLMVERGHRCEICGISEWTGQPTPLVLDHVDGNPENNSIANLRLLCPNCDALLPTYKSRNRGNGRWSRRARYAEGKSH